MKQSYGHYEFINICCSQLKRKVRTDKTEFLLDVLNTEIDQKNEKITLMSFCIDFIFTMANQEMTLRKIKLI